jgi:tetratricopeptide (TPR) repeat protein
MYEAQAQLADAYLAAGKGAEARVIAEDLVAREPWEGAHIERFRRALVMLRVPEPDTVIAERLSGQTPFVATDHFADPADIAETMVPEPPPPPAPPPSPAVRVHVPERPQPVAPPERVPETPLVEAKPPQPAQKGKRPSVEIDLTGVLGDIEGAAAATPPPQPPSKPASLDDVFTGFRKDAARAAGHDEAVQHLKLADTYLEMGMADDAAGSLKIAARSPRHRFEAASRLARLYKEQGDVAHALEWFERAAEAPAPTAAEGHALLYDLGLALEEAGESARALAVFLELLADTGGYRDISDRADRLTRVQTGG